MLGGAVRKQSQATSVINEVLTVVLDSLFPVCTRTYSITQGCAKSLNFTHPWCSVTQHSACS